MRRVFSSVVSSLLVMLAVGGGIALAAELEVIQAPLSEGVQDLTIDVWDFEPDTPVFVLPCDVPDSGRSDDVTTDTCRISEVVSAITDADGAATLEATWDIPPGGIAVYAGDESSRDIVTEIIDVAEPPGVEVLATTVTAQEGDTLPATGAEAVPLISLGVGLIALGGASLGAGRKLTPITV